MAKTKAPEDKRTSMRPRKGEIFVAFVSDDGSSIKMLVPRDKLQQKHRDALKAAQDAWFSALYPDDNPAPGESAGGQKP